MVKEHDLLALHWWNDPGESLHVLSSWHWHWVFHVPKMDCITNRKILKNNCFSTNPNGNFDANRLVKTHQKHLKKDQLPWGLEAGYSPSVPSSDGRLSMNHQAAYGDLTRFHLKVLTSFNPLGHLEFAKWQDFYWSWQHKATSLHAFGALWAVWESAWGLRNRVGLCRDVEIDVITADFPNHIYLYIQLYIHISIYITILGGFRTTN